MAAVTHELSGSGAGGILRFILMTGASAESCRLEVSVNGDSVYDAETKPNVNGMLHVNFHVHLLDEGLNRLALRVMLDGDAHEIHHDLSVAERSELGQKVRNVLLEHDVPLAFLGDCDAGMYGAARKSLSSWIDQDDALEKVEQKLQAGSITAVEARLLRDFIENGFVVLDEKLPEHMVVEANRAIDDAISSSYQGYEFGSSQRLELMHLKYPAIHSIWTHAPIHRFLSLVFGAESQPCQSLVYVFGSQQDAHQDTVHLTPFPAGMMCGVWIALEDVKEGAGELAVFPRSHRLPRVYMGDVGASKVRGDWTEFGEKVVGRWQSMLEESGLQAQKYLAKKGDILVWHENLMHAGRPRVDMSVSRRSIVTHNFAKGAIVYYDSSGDVGHVHDVINRENTEEHN